MATAPPTTIEVTLDGRDVRLTSLDRVLWPEVGRTKGWMLEAYAALAPVLLPHLRGRPVTMWRYPEGVHRDGWWQNECRGAPDWVRVYRYTGADAREHRHCVIDDVSSLLWLVNLGTVEIHPFLFDADEPGAARALVLDLDPGEPAGLREACTVATRVRELLDAQGLASFVKTSGVKGIHVVVPLNSGVTFEGRRPSHGRSRRSSAGSVPTWSSTDRPARCGRGGGSVNGCRKNGFA